MPPNPIISRQKSARHTARAVVRMEVHVEITRVSQELGEPCCVCREVWVRDEDPGLPNVNVPVGEIEIDSDGTRKPPDNGSCGGAGAQMMNVSESDALVPLVVENDDGFDCPILQDLDLRVPLGLRCARRYLDIGAHLGVEHDRRGFITGNAAGENPCVLTGNTLGIGN